MGKLIERPGGGGTVIDSRSKHEFSAKKGLGRVGRSTFLLGADQRLSGEGVFNGIYYCPLGLRAPCTCIPLCMRLVILMFWLRASTLSIVNSSAISLRKRLKFPTILSSSTKNSNFVPAVSPLPSLLLVISCTIDVILPDNTDAFQIFLTQQSWTKGFGTLPFSLFFLVGNLGVTDNSQL